MVDPSTGAITRDFVPTEIEFTEEVNGVVKIRKVAPFLELWAVTDDDRLVPVTIDLLKQNGATPSDLTWAVAVGNRKVERRTGIAERCRDGLGHRNLRPRRASSPGTSPNFVAGGGIGFGRCATSNRPSLYPQIRFRFTPADGSIYASTGIEQDKALRDWENPRFTTGQRVYDSTSGQGKGNWFQWQIPVDRDGVEDPWSTNTFRNETFPPSVRDRAAGAVVAQQQRRREPRIFRRCLRRNRRRQPRSATRNTDRFSAHHRWAAGARTRRACSFAAWLTISNRRSRAPRSTLPSRRPRRGPEPRRSSAARSRPSGS